MIDNMEKEMKQKEAEIQEKIGDRKVNTEKFKQPQSDSPSIEKNRKVQIRLRKAQAKRWWKQAIIRKKEIKR